MTEVYRVRTDKVTFTFPGLCRDCWREARQEGDRVDEKQYLTMNDIMEMGRVPVCRLCWNEVELCDAYCEVDK